ncbi:hypothetical protein ACLKA6_012970 [Drosophila palustris]
MSSLVSGLVAFMPWRPCGQHHVQLTTKTTLRIRNNVDCQHAIFGVTAKRLRCENNQKTKDQQTTKESEEHAGETETESSKWFAFGPMALNIKHA